MRCTEVKVATKKIIVASSKGGVGKSTVALGIAGALVAGGRSVLLCDLDFENRCLDLFMGLENVSLFNIADVADGLVTPSKAIIRNGAGLSFIAAPIGYTVSDKEMETSEKSITPESLKEALKNITEEAKTDYVIFDTGSGHTIPMLLADTFAGASVIITASHQLSSRRAAERTAEMFEKRGIGNIRLVINGYEFREAMKNRRSGIIEIIDTSRVRLIGVVPYDRNLMLSHERGVKPLSDSDSSIAFENIAGRICGKNIRLFDGIGNIKRSKIL